MELFKAMLLEIDLKNLIHFIALNTINKFANHLDESNILLALSL